MARVSKRYAPKGAFAPERLPPPPEPLREPAVAVAPVFRMDVGSMGDALAGVDADTVRAALGDAFWLPTNAGEESLVVSVRGDGSRVWDTEGREYLDARAADTGANLGHGRRDIPAAMHAQAERLSAASPAMPSIPAVLLAGRLAARAPTGAGSRVLFVPGRSEAVETALLIAKAYGRAKGFPGRYKVVGWQDADHGTTAGALAVSGVADTRTPFEPLVPGAIHVTPPHHVRCLYCANAEGCTFACADELHRALAHAGPTSVAAVIVEPVHSGGCMVPPPGYFERVRATCDAFGVLLIADETVCGMGRIGTLFAAEAVELRPDIVAVAGGLTGGYAALGAVIVSQAVADALPGEVRDVFAERGAFPGLPVAAAAALATLDLLEREELPGRSRDMGAYLLRELETALRDCPNVGEVRGRGLWVAVELVRDRASRAPFDDPATLAAIRDETRRRGLLCRVSVRPFPTLRLAPPLTIEREDVDRIVEIIAGTLSTMRSDAYDDRQGDEPLPAMRDAMASAVSVNIASRYEDQ